ncbi:MAG: HEPN domain-containing protein [Leptospiraceae bacterium]|nr:HEPN domain-containing protein [Leptospiraceae bacterium]MDW7976811.1 HEPN domain-containing protein [Leptospiraceae bacterium]
MTFEGLAKSYFEKAMVRLEVLYFLKEKKAFSDVVREAQEAVELATKGMLRMKGIEPPKYHDVSYLILELRQTFHELQDHEIHELVRISKRLRKERELAFYGDVDFIPTIEYKESDALQAIQETEFVINVAKKIFSIE